MAETKPQVLQIDSGSSTLPVRVDNGPLVEITFNPNDLEFAENLHSFYFEAKEKLVELNSKKEKKPEVDDNGMPLEIDSLMQDYKEMNSWLRGKIDVLLGEGTSQKIFGNTVYTGEKIDVYFQLFDGLFKMAAPQRETLVKKYVRNANGNLRDAKKNIAKAKNQIKKK